MAGKLYRRGRLSMVDLNVPDELVFILKILFTFVKKQATLMRRSIVLSLPLQLVFSVKGSIFIYFFLWRKSNNSQFNWANYYSRDQ
jgi:hypothetical protein